MSPQLRPDVDWHAAATAQAWDAGGNEELPTRAEQQDVLLALLSGAQIGVRGVLDLGVGSGKVAEVVLDCIPGCSLVGIDSSAAMLSLASDRLSHFGSRVHLVRHDLAHMDAVDVPALGYAAAFSVQTLHHLSDLQKRAAIAWVTHQIDPEGLLVIVDQVKVPEPLFHDWVAVWRRIGHAPASYAEYLEELASGGDQPASLEDHLAWMQGAGLSASCLHLIGNRALLVGRKWTS
jgi:tRNA (cmo5U34)-methyltransferase